MNKTLVSLLSILLFLSLIFSCQKEINWGLPEDKSSAGALKKDSNGDCLPVNVAGTYTEGVNLGVTNAIEVEVNVTRAGDYSITTDTVNGYSFKASGNFANTGSSITVSLKGSGRPILPGTNIFTVRYDTTICRVPVTVKYDISGPAEFALLGSPAACMNALLEGSYVKNIVLDTSSKVTIDVNVTVPGTYSVSTNTVNGYSFSGTGTLTATGTQKIVLTASGMPLNTGTNIFTVTAGPTTCTFPVTVLTAVVVTSTDYFPLTQNSFWVYDDLRLPGDSIKRTIIDTVTISGNLYSIMREDLAFSQELYNFRKAGGDYFEQGDVDRYTGSFQYGPPLNGLIPFLKETTTGNSWVSAEYNGTATFGQVIILQYVYFCANDNATVTVNGMAFTNVYKIVMMPQIKSVGFPFGPTNETYTYYYAKGVGLIYAKKTLQGFTTKEMAIRRWVVY